MCDINESTYTKRNRLISPLPLFVENIITIGHGNKNKFYTKMIVP